MEASDRNRASRERASLCSRAESTIAVSVKVAVPMAVAKELFFLCAGHSPARFFGRNQWPHFGLEKPPHPGRAVFIYGSICKPCLALLEGPAHRLRLGLTGKPCNLCRQPFDGFILDVQGHSCVHRQVWEEKCWISAISCRWKGSWLTQTLDARRHHRSPTWTWILKETEDSQPRGDRGVRLFGHEMTADACSLLRGAHFSPPATVRTAARAAVSGIFVLTAKGIGRNGLNRLLAANSGALPAQLILQKTLSFLRGICHHSEVSSLQTKWRIQVPGFLRRADVHPAFAAGHAGDSERNILETQKWG